MRKTFFLISAFVLVCAYFFMSISQDLRAERNTVANNVKYCLLVLPIWKYLKTDSLIFTAQLR